MDELRQPSSPLGVVNETLNETIIMDENRQQADYHKKTNLSKFWLQFATWIMEMNFSASIFLLSSGSKDIVFDTEFNDETMSFVAYVAIKLTEHL